MGRICFFVISPNLCLYTDGAIYYLGSLMDYRTKPGFPLLILCLSWIFFLVCMSYLSFYSFFPVLLGWKQQSAIQLFLETRGKKSNLSLFLVFQASYQENWGSLYDCVFHRLCLVLKTFPCHCVSPVDFAFSSLKSVIKHFGVVSNAFAGPNRWSILELRSNSQMCEDRRNVDRDRIT